MIVGVDGGRCGRWSRSTAEGGGRSRHLSSPFPLSSLVVLLARRPCSRRGGERWSEEKGDGPRGRAMDGRIVLVDSPPFCSIPRHSFFNTHARARPVARRRAHTLGVLVRVRADRPPLAHAKKETPILVSLLSCEVCDESGWWYGSRVAGVAAAATAAGDAGWFPGARVRWLGWREVGSDRSYRRRNVCDAGPHGEREGSNRPTIRNVCDAGPVRRARGIGSVESSERV